MSTSERMDHRQQQQQQQQQLSKNQPTTRRSTTSKRLLALFGMLVALSVFLSIQGTQWSSSDTFHITSTTSDESGIAPVHQEVALRSAAAPRTDASATRKKVSQKATKKELHPRENDSSSSQPNSISATAASSRATTSTTTNRTFSACLLIKDDNDILNEWIAYHYHVLNLRFMIVATDPFSQTSPTQLLDQWRQPPFRMSILEWKDEQYMPDYFLKGQFDQVPSFIPADVVKNPKYSIWHKHLSNVSIQEIKGDLVKINNHRFRQATFVSHCFRHYQQQQHSWAIHIDTDEYMVVNPQLRARPNAVKGVPVPTIPYAGSLIQFLQDMYQYYPKRLMPSCLMMPTILFGAKERNENKNDKNATTMMVTMIPPHWNRDRFESLRWTYHADLKDIVNGLQKAIVDVSTLPDDHPIFVDQLIKSVHQPLDSSYDHWKHPNKTKKVVVKQICRQMRLKPDVDAVRLFPLSLNHYMGSLERYTGRQDLRRNLDIYHEKNTAAVQGGVDGDEWIQGWLASFVDTHGVEASRRVLNEYYNP